MKNFLSRLAGGGMVGALVQGGVDLIIAKGETDRIIAYCEAVAEIAKATWRPIVARGLAISIFIYITIYIGFVVIAVSPWGVSYSDKAAGFFIREMQWIGALLFELSMLYFGLYVGGRSAEAVVKNTPVGAAMKKLFKPSDTTEQEKKIQTITAHVGVNKRKAKRNPLNVDDENLDKVEGVLYPDFDKTQEVNLFSQPEKNNTVIEAPQERFKFGKTSLRTLAPVYSDMQLLAHRALEITKFDFRVYSGLRTVAEQLEMFENEDSGTKNSRHLYGFAIDVMAYDENGKPTWDPRYYHAIYEAFKQASEELDIPIKWGGHMLIKTKTKAYHDYVHFELDRDRYPDDETRLVA